MLHRIKNSLKFRAKLLLAPLLYRHIPIGLSPVKLSLYLNTIRTTHLLHGAVVEIGCHLCGTTAIGVKMLDQLGSRREYYAFDTFSGFVPSQFEADGYRSGGAKDLSNFRCNGLDLARKILQLHKASRAHLVQADIVAMPPAELPETISMAQLDTDLYEPIMASLEKVYPRLEPGGVILVDDVIGNGWRAEQAFRDFCENNNLESVTHSGMGVLAKSLLS